MKKVLTFKNSQITALYNTLEAITFKPSMAKRGKGKLQKALIEADKELQENKTDVLEEYFEQDDKGKMIRDIDNDLIPKSGKDYKEGNDKLQELLDEEFKVDVLTYDNKLKAFYDVLTKDEYTAAEDKFSDVAFDTLMDELENVFENNKDSKEEK